MRCGVCKDAHVQTVVNEDLDKGLSAKFISETMAVRGFPVSADIILKHKTHRPPKLVEDGVKAKKRDIAILVQERAAELIEGMPAEELFEDRNDNLLKHGLAAQKALDTRERTKGAVTNVLLEFARLFGPRPVAALLEDGMTIDGEAVEVDD
jgi:hypothetical protein